MKNLSDFPTRWSNRTVRSAGVRLFSDFRLTQFLVLLCVSTAALSASAQPMTKHYGREDGLPSQFVFRITQDHEGFIWLATDKGIARYDGSFTRYSGGDGLTADLAYDVHRGDNGVIWVATYEGGVCRSTNALATDPGFALFDKTGTFYSIENDSSDRLFARSPNGLYYSEAARFIKLKSFVDDNNQSRLVRLADGTILASSPDSLFWVTSSSEAVSVNSEPLPPIQRPSSGEWNVAPVIAESSGGLLLAYDSGESTSIWRKGIKSPSSSWELILTTERRVTALQPLADGSVLVGTRTGLEKYTSLSSGPEWRLFDREFVRDIMVDYEGSVWVAVFGRGIYRLAGEYLRTLPLEQVQAPEIAWVWRDRQQRLWAGAERKLYVVDAAGTREFSGPYRLGGAAQLSDDRFLIGFSNSVFGPVDEAFDAARADLSKRTVLDNWVSSIYVDPADTVWIATYGSGVFQYHEDSLVRTFTTDHGLATDAVDGIVPAANAVWFLSRSGGATRRTGSRLQSYDMTEGLPSHATYSVLEDSAGTIWLGTDRGVAELREGLAIVHTADGLLEGERVLALAHDGRGPRARLMAVTDKYVYEFGDGDFIRIGSAPVVQQPSSVVNNAYADLPTGRILLATSTGVTELDLFQIHRNETPPRVAVTNVVAGGVRELPSTDGFVSANHKRNDIVIGVAALSFTNERAVRTQYRLGESGSWSEPSTERKFTLVNVPPGRHEVRIRAVSADGVPSQKPAALTLNIIPPFWRSTWSLTMAGLLLIVVAVAFVRHLATRKLRERLRALEIQGYVDKERARISRDLHDHVGAQVSNLIAGIELARLMQRHENNGGTERHLAALEEDARLTMSHLRDTIWALKRESLTVAEFVDQIARFLRQRTQYAGPVAEPVRVTGPNLDANMRPDRALGMFRIAQEAINNAVKHSGARRLAVDMKVSERSLEITVNDDGCFQRRAENERGSGLTNMRLRADEIGALFAIKPSASGTTVSLNIPLDEILKTDG